MECQVEGVEHLEGLKRVGEAFTRNWEWSWETSVEGVVKEAVALLEKED